MSFALIGPGKLGRVLFQAAAGPRLVIGRSPEGLEPFRDRMHLQSSGKTVLSGSISPMSETALSKRDCMPVFFTTQRPAGSSV